MNCSTNYQNCFNALIGGTSNRDARVRSACYFSLRTFSYGDNGKKVVQDRKNAYAIAALMRKRDVDSTANRNLESLKQSYLRVMNSRTANGQNLALLLSRGDFVNLAKMDSKEFVKQNSANRKNLIATMIAGQGRNAERTLQICYRAINYKQGDQATRRAIAYAIYTGLIQVAK